MNPTRIKPRNWAIFFTTAAAFFSSPSFASVGLAPNCPKEFVGKVIAIDHSETPLKEITKKMTVTFEVEEARRGEVGAIEEVRLLQYGAERVLAGDRYTIQLKDGLICSVKKL